MKSIFLERGKQRREFFFRPGTSDERVIQQIFNTQTYSLSRLARNQELLDFRETLRQAGRRPLIVDAGANIGASAVFFALSFPEALIVAVEPEPDNFAVLSRNVEGLNVRCIQAAIAANSGSTRLLDPGLGAWGYRTDPSGQGPELPTFAMSRLLEEYAAPPYDPFLVKIDIEGGEKELFAADTDWVRQAPLIILELHDWLLPRQGTALPFLRCIAALDRDFVFIGENVFSIANQLNLANRGA